ncbi:MAG TPA: PQQ-dependent sugar dehydrogenase [Planctomycetia bacterium]|nr:PQQ-dependent sugar dehydrogenase [Planctomycetia bacterium]
MNRLLAAGALFVVGAVAADAPKTLTTGLVNPESVAINRFGRIFVSEIGEFGKAGDGRILAIDAAGKATPFTTGLDDPKGLAFASDVLFVTDVDKVIRIDEKGGAKVFAAKEAFPRKPVFLNDVVVDPKGVVYVSDSGDNKDDHGAIFRIEPNGRVSLVASDKSIPDLKGPNGLALDGVNHLLNVDFVGGVLRRVKIADGSAETVATGFEGGDGLAWDMFGRLFISSWGQGKVWGIAKAGDAPVLMHSGMQSSADLCVDASGNNLLVPDMKAGTLVSLSATIAGAEVDVTPLPYKGVPAFPGLRWTGWEEAAESTGAAETHRPIVLTHAGDGSGRTFVALQQGTVHILPKEGEGKATKLFMDIQKKVLYLDKENEQGFLGMAFHPKFKENGEFFVYYSVKQPRFTNVISRFRVSKTDPNQADPDSEEEIMRFTRKYWNHDGGTIVFGPDGFLYVALGDGGNFNDPHKNGQNLKTYLGKILRVDVDGKDAGKKYRVPADNPFVGKEGAMPEIWAYGVRNPWRIAFDRADGKLWMGDVGQDLFEEICIIEKGGNYGWNIRESFHPFGRDGVGVRKDLVDPIWEYHHDVGKSITGGNVYRGKRLPELEGYYLYADYISSKMWALKYDFAKKRVVANRPMENATRPVFSYGEDEAGETYYLGPTATGQGIFKFEKASGK